MPYVGGSLVSLFDAPQQDAAKLAARRMAVRGSNFWQKVTTENTPIHTGNLRTSWYSVPVQKIDHAKGPAYQGGIASDVDYAPHVEYGTGLWGPSHSKYKIESKTGGMLRWRGPDGEYVYARSVMHPGSPGQHMVAIGGHITEAMVDFEDIGAEFVATVERQAD